jgi:hypothetical protein
MLGFSTSPATFTCHFRSQEINRTLALSTVSALHGLYDLRVQTEVATSDVTNPSEISVDSSCYVRSEDVEHVDFNESIHTFTALSPSSTSLPDEDGFVLPSRRARIARHAQSASPSPPHFRCQPLFFDSLWFENEEDTPCPDFSMTPSNRKMRILTASSTPGPRGAVIEADAQTGMVGFPSMRICAAMLDDLSRAVNVMTDSQDVNKETVSYGRSPHVEVRHKEHTDICPTPPDLSLPSLLRPRPIVIALGAASFGDHGRERPSAQQSSHAKLTPWRVDTSDERSSSRFAPIPKGNSVLARIYGFEVGHTDDPSSTLGRTKSFSTPPLPTDFATRFNSEPRVPRAASVARTQASDLVSGYLASVFGSAPKEIAAKVSSSPPLSDLPSIGLESSDSPITLSSPRKDRSARSKRKKEARRIAKLARANERQRFAASVKIEPPITYDGTPDFDMFEQWVYSINHWFSVTDFPELMRVPHLQNFLSGKANQWFMSFVAPDPTAFTVESLGKDLFNYCFPPQFRRLARQKFSNLTQGDQTLRKFIRELRTLASRLPDITDFQIALRLWDGAEQYLRSAWLRDGFDSEFSSLSQLEESGYRFEQARNSVIADRAYAYASDEQDEDGTSRSGSHSPDTLENEEHVADQDNDESQSDEYPPDDSHVELPSIQYQTSSEGSDSDPGYDDNDYGNEYYDQFNETYPSAKYITEDDRADLRQYGQCYLCREVGHRWRDCPSTARDASSDRDPDGSNEVDDSNSDDPDNDYDFLLATGRCFNCREIGHRWRDCPQADDSAQDGSGAEYTDESEHPTKLYSGAANLAFNVKPSAIKPVAIPLMMNQLETVSPLSLSTAASCAAPTLFSGHALAARSLSPIDVTTFDDGSGLLPHSEIMTPDVMTIDDLFRRYAPLVPSEPNTPSSQ